MVYSGEYEKDIYYNVIKINNSIEGIIEYKPTQEICRIEIEIEESTYKMICRSVYRRVKGRACYVFLMSKQTVEVRQLLERIGMEVLGKFPMEVEIPSDFCLQTRLKKRTDNLFEEEIQLNGTWEDDNISVE